MAFSRCRNSNAGAGAGDVENRQLPGPAQVRRLMACRPVVCMQIDLQTLGPGASEARITRRCGAGVLLGGELHGAGWCAAWWWCGVVSCMVLLGGELHASTHMP